MNGEAGYGGGPPLEDAGESDHERRLNVRGRETAPIIGRYLEAWSGGLDLALSSSAARARETWELIAPELAQAPPLIVDERLYLCGFEAVSLRLQELDDDIHSVIVIAHNPDLQILTVTLSSDRGSEATGRARQKFPTAGLARLDLAIDSWPDLRPACGQLTWFETPKRLALRPE